MDKLRVLEYKEAQEKIRAEDVIDYDILKRFLNLVGKTKKGYTISSKKKDVQDIYRQCSPGVGFTADLLEIARSVLHAPPNQYQIDIAVTVMSLIEMKRHDDLMDVVQRTLHLNGFKVIAYDFKISDYFPQLNSIITPDMLFEDDNGNRYILEIKVRNKNTDLKYYYDRYKDVVKDYALVSVFNLTDINTYSFGDFDIEKLVTINEDDLTDIITCIEIAKELRAKYSQFPQFALYMVQAEISHPETFISGFDKKLDELECYNEIKDLFGSHWDDIIHLIETFDLITNKEGVTEELINADQDLHQYCDDHFSSFEHHLEENYLKTNKYNKTILRNSGLDMIIDEKNKKIYNITDKCKPSIYIPITKTIKLAKYGGSRMAYYRDAFVGLKIIGDPYSKSAYNLIDQIFNSINIEILMTKDAEIDPEVYSEVLDPTFISHIKDKNVKFKKIATVSGITSDVTILANNSFSINSAIDPMMKTNICGYKKKWNDGIKSKKSCLDYSLNCLKLHDLDAALYEIFYSEHHKGVYSHDLLSAKTDSVLEIQRTIPEAAQTKYMEHLYNCHTIYKSIISLNTINSHKYRLLQSPDPSTILILLPNSDGLKGSPLRYFVVSILEKSDQASIQANKLLGIYHSHTESTKYNIMISKVISLDLNRLKLLSSSFVKYSLLITYYSNFKQKLKLDTHTLVWLLSQFTTIASLSITDVYKNFIMATYSDYSNIDELIQDKLACRPTTLGHIFVMKHLFQGITNAVEQLHRINSHKNETDIDESGELIQTGFDKNLRLKLPISQLGTNNPKEIIHEAFILFYLGNKGLHGSPQELLNLYYTPMKFEKEYTAMINEVGTLLQEEGNNTTLSFSFKAMFLTSKAAYAKILNQSDDVRKGIIKELKLDDPILSLKQFSSTKSMVSNTEVNEEEKGYNLNKNIDLFQLENHITTSKINDVETYVVNMNHTIDKINLYRQKLSPDKLSIGLPNLPRLMIKFVKGKKFICLEGLKYSKLLDGDYIKQNNTKVFDEFYRLTEELNIVTLRDFYTRYIHLNDLLVRIFYKDQRTSEDREIYTGNAQVRLCLYPVESTYKAICKKIPEEAITISGDQKQKRLLDQRLSLLKTKRQLNRTGYNTEIYSVSSDASKWSARDLLPKFILVIASNPYLTPDEKYFLIYLLIRYYNKKIILTDDAFNNALNFCKEDMKGKYEEMTNDFTSNHFTVRSNWLQGNLNMISSFVHHCSTLMTSSMMSILAKENRFQCVITSMVHSDDSTYDFLIATKEDSSKLIKNTQNIGKIIISLITYSNSKHCITLNEKKTYISVFYKEFLSTVIVANELFFFYMADLIPLASDTSYKSPLEDLASYTGYINNAFSHACPYNIVDCAITLLNHLTLSTYNLQITSVKNPKANIKDANDLPVQIYPRYKIPIEFAGSIPYYSADALKILDDVIYTMEKNDLIKKSLLEDVVDDQTLQDYIDAIKDTKPGMYKYIQACLLTMDYSQYERDDQDPYNIIDYDLSQKSLINVTPLNKGQRIRKTYTYKKYLENEDDIKLTSAVNPIWCMSKPKDDLMIKKSILANYSNPNFKDSLIFSKPALDYGRRIIGSNRSMYTLSSHAFEKEKPSTITEIYRKLDKSITNVVVTKENLQRYLSIYLFSDKKISVALQIYYSKVEVVQMMKPEITKIIIPRSVYSEEYGRYSNTSMMESLLIEPYCNVETIDTKAEKFITFSSYILKRCGDDIKVYEYPEDIDDDFKNYMTFKYSLNNMSDGLIQVHENLGEVAMDVYHNKIKFQGLMIKYYKDIKQTLINKDYNIPNYTSPNSIIMTLDSMMKRDEISTKVYMSHIKTNRYDEYWLSRFGMYASNDFFIKYKVGYKIRVATNDKLMPSITKIKSIREPFSALCQLITKDRQLWFDLVNKGDDFKIGNMGYNELLSEMAKTTDFNYNLYLYMINKMTTKELLNIMNVNKRVFNHWIMPTNTNGQHEDESIALYMYQSVVVMVKTFPINNNVSFSMTLLRARFQDYKAALSEISKKITSDYASQLRRAIHIPMNNRLQFCVNEYGRPVDSRHKYASALCTINLGMIHNFKVDIFEVDDQIKMILHVVNNISDCEFILKLRTYCDPDYYICSLIDNIDLYPEKIAYSICSSGLLHMHPEYFQDLTQYITPGSIIELFSKSKGVDEWSVNIDVDKFAKLCQIGNYLEDQMPKSIVVTMCKTLKLLALENNLDIEGKVNPEKFIKSLSKFKITSEYSSQFYNHYRKNEEEPYTELIMAVSKSFSTRGPIPKIILAIISIFKAYTDRFLESSDDIEF